jgi:hypothetical protein
MAERPFYGQIPKVADPKRDEAGAKETRIQRFSRGIAQPADLPGGHSDYDYGTLIWAFYFGTILVFGWCKGHRERVIPERHSEVQSMCEDAIAFWLSIAVVPFECRSGAKYC